MKTAFIRLAFILVIFTAAVTAGYAQAVNSSRADTVVTNARPATVSQPVATGTTAAATGTAPAKPLHFQPNPKKAGLYSSLIPGLGQLYNRQYWKIPVVYAGLSVAGYFLIDNLNQYNSYRQAYIARIANPYYQDQYVNYTEAQLQQLQNDYSKYLDITVLITGVAYMLQVLDAITSAHLKNFDISRDITMRVQPVINSVGAGNGVGVGMGLVLNLKPKQ